MRQLIFQNPGLIWLSSLFFALLLMARGVSSYFKAKATSPQMLDLAEELKLRIRSWAFMIGIFGVALMLGKGAITFLFATISFFALQEFLLITPSSKSDRLAIWTIFFVVLPVQYWLIKMNWYGLYSIFIPVYAITFLQLCTAIASDTVGYCNRTSQLQMVTLLCVYFPSYAAALLNLNIGDGTFENWKLLCFMILVGQSSDVLQYIFGKLFGRHKIAPLVSPNKTIEGFVGGVLSASLIGFCLKGLTPFNGPQAFGFALLISIAGFLGGLVFSSVKRDRGVKDFGKLIPGHGGVLDRIDSLCFAAPLIFHLTRFYFAK
jgi:phosphatidate cytidylyltransferase